MQNKELFLLMVHMRGGFSCLKDRMLEKFQWVPDIKPTGLQAESYNKGLQAEIFLSKS